MIPSHCIGKWFFNVGMGSFLDVTFAKGRYCWVGLHICTAYKLGHSVSDVLKEDDSYVSILIFALNLSVFANCRSQFLLDRLGRFL